MQSLASKWTQNQRAELSGLFTFFGLAFGLPWVGWFALRLIPTLSSKGETLALFWLPAACSVAGFVAAAVEQGSAGLWRFSHRVFGCRVRPSTWALAILLPLVAGAMTFASHLTDLWHVGPIASAGLVSAATFANFWTGPLAEEFGWRGYLFSRLERRMSPLLAGLVIGPIWALWHFPLFYDSAFTHVASAVKFIGTTTAWSVVLAYLVDRARGSVLPSVLGHWTINTQSMLFASLLPALPHDRLPGGWPFCFAAISIAVLIAVVWQYESRRSRPALQRAASL